MCLYGVWACRKDRNIWGESVYVWVSLCACVFLFYSWCVYLESVLQCFFSPSFVRMLCKLGGVYGGQSVSLPHNYDITASHASLDVSLSISLLLYYQPNTLSLRLSIKQTNRSVGSIQWDLYRHNIKKIAHFFFVFLFCYILHIYRVLIIVSLLSLFCWYKCCYSRTLLTPLFFLTHTIVRKQFMEWLKK